MLEAVHVVHYFAWGSMPTYAFIGRLRIRMYPNDHDPPHFHILTPDHAVAVALEDLRILAGQIPERDLRVGLAWARQNLEILKSEWERLSGNAR